MNDTAIVIATGHFQSTHGKTTHALVRSSRRYDIAGVIEPALAGQDAGEALDGRRRNIPIFASVGEALERLPRRPDWCILGVATAGGVLPPEVRAEVVAAAGHGISLVNGLHRLLAEDPEISALAAAHGARIVDIRRPRPTSELRFWTGEVLSLSAARVPVLGTDCACGKRTTCTLLRDACRAEGLRAEMVFTGQTGWLQGNGVGFILDSTPNDFVCGELERAVLDCQRASRADIVFVEGQAALRNPSGPCGSELIVSLGATGVVLQHPVGRRYYLDNALNIPIRPVPEEVALIRMLGSEVWAVTLNDAETTPEEAQAYRTELERELGVPVVLPLREGVGRVVQEIRTRIAARRETHPTR